MAEGLFPNLSALAGHLRCELEAKRFVLLYAYNGTGKTRLSGAFKDLGKHGGDPDTLYYNAFTEDLFQWDNDLEHDRERVLRINSQSRFFAGLEELEMDNRIRPLLNRYADFDFRIDTESWEVSFSRRILIGEATTVVEDIKVSRGEENIFIWCFFLAIVQLVLDGAEAYKWVKYIYVDDPISSLDENNAIAVANHLAQIITYTEKTPPVVISTHHVLFFNVLCNEIKDRKAHKLFLKQGAAKDSYSLVNTSAKPFLQHLSILRDLDEVQKSGALFTYHFNMMRRVMEQTASFFGLSNWQDCIKSEEGDANKLLHERMINLMSHGDYSLYEPREMMEENKEHFRTIFRNFIHGHPFGSEVFPKENR